MSEPPTTPGSPSSSASSSSTETPPPDSSSSSASSRSSSPVVDPVSVTPGVSEHLQNLLESSSVKAGDAFSVHKRFQCRDAVVALSTYLSVVVEVSAEELPLDLGMLLKLCADTEWKAVHGFLLHAVAVLTEVLDERGVAYSLQDVGTAVFRSFHEATPAAVEVANVLLLRHPVAFSEIACTPILGELLQLLEHQDSDTDRTNLLRLLGLGNALLSAFTSTASNPSRIPASVAQNIISGLSEIDTKAAKAVREEATLFREGLRRYADSTADPEVRTELHNIEEAANVGGGGGGGGAGGSVKKGGERTYTESDVKSFLYQRKLEWEGQVRKKDKSIAGLQAQLADERGVVHRTKEALQTCEANLSDSRAKVEELEQKVASCHEQNLQVESKLAETLIFLREREHQAVNLEEQLSKTNVDITKLQTENQVLGQSNEQMMSSQAELETYVKELMDEVETSRAPSVESPATEEPAPIIDDEEETY